SLLVPGLNHKLDLYSLWFRPVPGLNLKSDPCNFWFLLVLDLNLKSDPYSFWFLPVPGPNLKADLYNLWFLLALVLNYISNLYKLWARREQSSPTSISTGGQSAFEHSSNSIGVVPRKKPCPRAGNIVALPPAKEPEKMLTLHQGLLVFISSTHLEQRGVKEAGEHMFPLLFIQKKKPNLWVPASKFRIFGCSPYKKVKSNDSTKKQDSTTLLPLFLAMYPDILLEEAKATCLSRFPRQRASTSFQGYAPLRASKEIVQRPRTTRINKSREPTHSKGDSRRGDESLNDIQKTLRVVHLSGGREQPRHSGSKPRSIPACGPIWVQDHMRSCQPILQAQGRRSTVALPERTKEHMECRPGAKSKNVAPYARGTKVIGKAYIGARQHPGTSMFQKGLPQNLRVPRESVPQTPGDEAHKPPGFRRINSRTSEPQEVISIIARFREKDLRPAKSIRNCRTTSPTKVLLPRSGPIDLEGTPNGSTEGNGCYLDNSPHPIDIESGPSPEDRVRCCIKSTETLVSRQQNKDSPPGAISTDPPVFPRINLRVLQDHNMKPFKALDSKEESAGTTSSYAMVVRRRIGLHASTKGPGISDNAKPKGPATDKPMLMPTEAMNASPSGLAPTRENYFRPRGP
ncbi:LOW QUALITY PROTEIN: hypothetical protein HID58_083942, partial [Brassica napus]